MSRLAFPVPPTQGLTQAEADARVAALAVLLTALPLTPTQAGLVNRQVFEVYAAYPGQNYAVSGFTSSAGWTGVTASTANKIRGARVVAPSAAAAATADLVIGGFNVETNNRIFYCSSTSKWVCYNYFSTTTLTSFRGAATMATASPADTDGVSNNSLGIRLRLATSPEVFAYSTNTSGTTVTGTTGITPAADTNYVVRTIWDGATASIAVATIDASGVWGTFSTAVTFTGSQLPTSTTPLTPTQKWWNHGATQPTVDIGGAQVVPGTV